MKQLLPALVAGLACLTSACSEEEAGWISSLQPVVMDLGWSSTGTMSVDRLGHAVSLLPSGKVLASGGCVSGGSPCSASAELYDPATGTWQATGSMLSVRASHTSTVLLSGLVLVAGGNLLTAELYDPAMGSWQQTGMASQLRAGSTATLLPTGRVLVVGGGGAALPEVYDPVTGSWGLAGSIVRSNGHTATLLPSGKVLVTGGVEGGAPVTAGQLYDPASSTWGATGAMGVPRSSHVATLLTSGQVLVTGGVDATGGELASAEIYDPVTETWSPTGSMGTVQGGSLTSTLLPSGKVLVTGGLQGAELYDPALGTWLATDNPRSTDARTPALLLPSGKVLIASPSSGLYHPPAGTCTATAPLTRARTGAAVAHLPDGRVLVTGGEDGGGPISVAELYDPATGAWTATGSMRRARHGHSATLLPNGTVLVAGGYGVKSAEIYDPISGTWSLTSPLAEARGLHTATLLPSGAVLVAGGHIEGIRLATAEIYSPSPGTWAPARSMRERRSSHTATLLRNGQVLVAGGTPDGTALKTTELYDPALDEWRDAAPLSFARRDHTATLLPSGAVLIAGGQDDFDFLPSAELYTTATGAWRMTGAMAGGRFGHTATALPGGEVLVTSGWRNSVSPVLSAEVYDEASERWSFAGTLEVGRGTPAAIWLPNGRVLVVGGTNAELHEETGASDAWRPSLAAPPPLRTGAAVTVNGSRLRGISEASSGSWYNNSPTNVPVVELLPPSGNAGIRVPLQAFSDLSLTLTVPPVPEGYYLLTVTANAVPGGRLVFVDGPPAAPGLTAPPLLAASARPPIAGGAEAGSTVEVSVDGISLGTTTAGEDGTWSFTPATTLPDGPHLAIARATDAQGRAGLWSSPRRFTIDTLPPARPTLTGPPVFVANRYPRIGGTAEAGSQVMIWMDGVFAATCKVGGQGYEWSYTDVYVDHVGGVLAGTCWVGGAGTWSFNRRLEFSDGPHWVAAQAQDPTGNIGPVSMPRSFTVDTAAPPQPVLITPASEAVLSGPRPIFTGTAESGSTVTVNVDASVACVTGADGAGAWSCRSALDLLQGLHTIYASAKDAAGNQGGIASRLFRVGSSTPTVVIATPIEGAVEISPTPLISGLAEVGRSVTVWLDGALAGTVWTSNSGSWSLIPTAPLARGPHMVVAWSTDTAGNSSFSATRFFSVHPLETGMPSGPDTIAPPVPVLVAPHNGALLEIATPELSGTAEPRSTVWVMLDGAVAGVTQASDTEGWTFIPVLALSDGLHTVTLRGLDAAGNASPVSSPRAFTIQRSRSFYGSGCSVAPSGGLGGALLLFLALSGPRRTASRVRPCRPDGGDPESPAPPPRWGPGGRSRCR